jgi:ABC-type sugar transport system substrate-binding protein
MKRREFIAGLGAVAAWPAVARAQQKGRIPTVGIIMVGRADEPQLRNRVRGFESAFPELKLIE